MQKCLYVYMFAFTNEITAQRVFKICTILDYNSYNRTYLSFINYI